MSGRVKRRKAAAAGAALAADRAAAAVMRCALCDRLLGRRTEQHHVVPKSEGGRETVPLHPICHRMIHATLSNSDLARFGDLERVRTEPAVACFLMWIADKPSDFHVPVRRKRGGSASVVPSW